MAVHARSTMTRRSRGSRPSHAPARLVRSLPLALLALPFFPSAAVLTPAPSPLGFESALAEAPLDRAGLVLAKIGEEPALYVRDPNARVPAERGGRVGPTPLATVQPKFAAGRLVDPASLLRAGIALGDENLRTAFAPEAVSGDYQVAASFAPKPGESKPGKDRSKGGGALMAVAALSGKGFKSETAGSPVAAAYAGETRPGLSTLFDAVLGPTRGFVPPKGENDHDWVATPLPASAYTPEEQTCLAKAVYFEARGETDQGQAAVAQVVLNRVRNPSYPKTICGVVYQNADWFGRCQFSFACDGIKDIIWNRPAYVKAERIAREATNGELWLPEVGSATHYHATYVHPRWAKTMEKVDKIGLHIFYRTFGGGWR